MHWSRWGDPAQAGPLSESALALVDAFLGTSDSAAVAPEEVRLSEPLADDLLAELAEIVGAEHVLTDHATRLHRTRGKSTPDLLKLRARRRHGLPGRRRATGHARRGGCGDRVVRAPPRRAGAVRRRHLGGRRPRGSPRGLRRGRLAGPAALRQAARGGPRVDDRAARARTARASGGGAARGGGAHPRPLPAVLRVRLDRRLRGDPVLRPVLCRLRPVRLAGRGAQGGHAAGHARARHLPGQRRRPGPSRARDGLRGSLRRGHGGPGAGATAPRRQGVRRLAVRRPSPRGRPRCAHSRRPGCSPR